MRGSRAGKDGKHEKTREKYGKKDNFRRPHSSVWSKVTKSEQKLTFLIPAQNSTTGCGDRSSEKTRKRGKHGKVREKPARKQPIWNTIEQYAGLKSVAASHFSDEKCDENEKVQNRPFS